MPDSDMTLAPNSYYNHEDHGRVQLRDVDDYCWFETPGGRHLFETPAEFREHAEPAPVTLRAPPTTAGTITPNPTGGDA